MHSRHYRYLFHRVLLLTAVVAVTSAFGVLANFFLKGLDRSSTLPIISGLFASVVGATTAYAIARALKLASRDHPTAFISYSHHDSEFARKLAKALNEIKVEAIIDRAELKVGDNIRSAVDQMIDRSDYFLCILSNNSANSNWAKIEIDQATKRDKKILPVVLDVNSVPESLSGVYYADFSGDFEAGVAQLEKTLARKRP